MSRNNYNCSQAELYMACRAAWRLCRKNLADFSAFKTKYTADFIDQNMAEIEDADYQQDVNARYVESEGLRMDLVKAKDDILVAYRHLQAYIDDAYMGEMRGKMYNASGKPFYERASQCKWASVSGLLRGAIPFIEENRMLLVANNNMPESFIAKFKQLQTRFDGIHAQYNDSDADASDKTSAKIVANNAIYEKMVAVLDDGKRLYAGDAEMAKNFMLTSIMSQVSGNKQAGIDGRITKIDKKNPVKNAKITVLNSNNVGVTNKMGRYSIYPLAAATYSVLIEADGFESITVKDIQVKTGVMKRVSVILKAVAVEDPVLEPVLQPA